MRPDEQCKKGGLEGIREMSKITGETLEMLRKWHEKKPRVFQLLLIGARAEKIRISLSSDKALTTGDLYHVDDRRL